MPLLKLLPTKSSIICSRASGFTFTILKTKRQEVRWKQAHLHGHNAK